MRDANILYGIKRFVLNLLITNPPLVGKWNMKRLERKGTIIRISEMDNYLNAAAKVLISPLPKGILIGLVKSSKDNIFKDFFFKRDSYPKYERFLINNKILYSIYNIDSSSWQDDAKKFDVVIWQPPSSPDSQANAKSKIYFLERYLGKKCFPSYEEIWSYEDKVRSSYLYTNFKLPAVPTFTTNSKEDALEFLNVTTFPLISKITTGSSSYGVLKLKNKKEAIRYVNSCFSERGRKTYWPFERQKNYVYFQKFINDAKYDLRIIVVGNKIFGYYRYAKPGDFRASGSGLLEKKTLPDKAMKLAVRVNEILQSTSLTVDLLYSEKEEKYYIIETSIFCGIDTAEQLVIDGKAGYYEYNDEKIIFREGRFWIQELALEKFFNSLRK